MSVILGCIADDITGATDIALMLSSNGMRVVQMLSLPEDTHNIDADAVVVAQKTRSISPRDAVSQSIEALRWLETLGCQQFFFKYCSTFDSTPEGNIGPVLEACLNELGETYTLACPSFPKNGRKVFNGYLFVHDVLLSESSLKNHPLTPMTDANLVRVLEPQMAEKKSVGLIHFDTVNQGTEAIRVELSAQQSQFKCSIVDAINDQHLRDIAAACSDLKLLTGGSALAMGLPDNYRAAGQLPQDKPAVELPVTSGPALIIAGSCSLATQAQVKKAQETIPSLVIDPLALADGSQSVETVIAEFESTVADQQAFLVYSTSDSQAVEAVQSTLGMEKAASLIENTFSELAKALVEKGVSKIVVAGGETSGAVAQALDAVSLTIGPEIAPGVPWTIANLETPVLLAFKSGNFGNEDFFMTALEMLP